jgi:hypothetical protein
MSSSTKQCISIRKIIFSIVRTSKRVSIIASNIVCNFIYICIHTRQIISISGSVSTSSSGSQSGRNTTSKRTVYVQSCSKQK